jgi:hypothetical protein
VLRGFLVWLQALGRGEGEFDRSWSEALAASVNFWSLVEGTHLIGLMLFVGTIFVVDLRLLGVAFRRTRVSVVSDRVLPLTAAGFAIVVVTGLALFFANPLVYYHNIWFRLKLGLLAFALVNIVVFHIRVQRKGAAWDSWPTPPAGARAAAAISLTAWVLVVSMGRFVAYDWFECGKPLPDFLNAAQSCAASAKGAVGLDGP